MKTISTALRAHYAQGSTTIARCWRFVRRDGLVVRVTTCSIDLLINGEVYKSRDGVVPTAIEGSPDASVHNSEVNGTLSATLATEADILAGLWDGATVTIFEVNYRDLTMGTLQLQQGTIGNVKAGRSKFNAEVRGLSQALQQTVGRVYMPTCDATLGDSRCKVNLATYTVTGAVTSLASRQQFTDTGRLEAFNHFTNGVITWLTGANAGFKEEIGSFVNGVVGLKLPMTNNIAVGDTYSMVAGCNKTLKGSSPRYGSATTVSNAATFVIYDATRTEPVGTYAGGSLVWQSGAQNIGSASIIASSPGSLSISSALPNPVFLGDPYIVTPPASVLYNGDCKVKFNNVVNFRGFPNVPGSDLILGLGGTQETQL
jgi:uncharacterized phage protein (TIGR02218 family)